MLKQNIVKILKNDGVGILPTDTLYGIVASTFSKKAVERIYKIKGRDENKPFIILISNIKDLEKFGVVSHSMLSKWPAKTSIILQHTSTLVSKKFNYLNRGTGALAFRLPKKESLIELLKKTGPLVAPSANPQGLEPAKNIREAKEYFGDKMDFYVAGGTLISAPSTLLRIDKNGGIEVLRGTLKSRLKDGTRHDFAKSNEQ